MVTQVKYMVKSHIPCATRGNRLGPNAGMHKAILAPYSIPVNAQTDNIGQTVI